MKTLERGDVFSIFEMLNQDRKERALTLADLEEAFDVRWSEFNRELNEAITVSDSSTERILRSDRAILEEVLESVRSLNALLSEAKPGREAPPMIQIGFSRRYPQSAKRS
jgi:hypothetical protein